MNGDKFTYEIEFRRNRVEQLHQSAKELFLAPRNLLREAFEELNTALEELEVAYDQLCQKNEELAIARKTVEVERQRYQELFECAPDGYLVTDTNGIIQEANQAAARLLNVQQHFLVGKPLLIFIPKEERAAFRFELDWLRLVEREPEWIIHLCPFNAKPFDAALSVASICDWEGKVIGRRWLLRDITYRLETEEMLKIHGRVLESLVEGVKVYDENGIIFFTNPAFDTMFGYQPGELTGKHVSILSTTSPQESNRIIGEISQQFQSQGAWKGEFNNRKKDGTLFISSAQISSLEVAGKKYWVSVQEDITKRKRIESALRQTKARYQAVVEDQTELICRCKPDGTITFVNDAYCRYFNKKREELIGHSFIPLIPEEDQEKCEKHLASLSPASPVATIEHRVIVKEEVRWQQWNNRAVFDEHNHLIELQSVGRDISQFKRTEAALRESEEALWESQTRFHKLAENVNEVFWLIAPTNFEVSYVSPAYEKIWGRSCKSVYQEPMSFMEAIHPEDRDRVATAMKKQSQGEDTQEEYRIVRPDGSVRWIWERAFSILDESGQVNRVCAIAQDITERKQIEEDRRESEARLRLALEVARMGTWNWNILTNDVVYSDQLGPVFGLPIGSYHPTYEAFLDSIHPEDRESVALAVARAVEEGTDYGIEFRVIWPDGTLHWIGNKGRVYRDETDRPIRMVCVAMDITERKQAEEALRQSEEQYRRIIETTSEGVWIIDAESKTVFVNSQMAQMLGYTLEEMQGQPLFAFMDEEGMAIATANIERRRQGIQEQHDFKFRRKDGSDLWAIVSTNPIFDQLGNYAGSLGMLTDITERKLSEQILRKSEARNRALLNAIPDLMFRVSPDGTFLDFKRTKDYSLMRLESEFLGKKISEVLPNQVAEVCIHSIEQALSTGEVQTFEYQLPQNGNLIDFEARIVSVGNDEALIIVRDITERKQAQAMIQYQAFHDLLTGLPNRTLFNDRLLQSLVNARRSQNILAVMFLDLDRFKTINDTLGHAVGDQLLQQVAQRVIARLREGDTFARWGGDEFTLLLPQISCSEQAAKIAQRILDTLQEPFNLECHELYITSSIGIALCPCDGEDVQTLLRNADAALYRAKEQGRNNYQFYIPAMNSHAQELLTLENRLHHALKQGEFVLYYQPQVNINTGELTGIEALVRWQHPELGLVPPETFIPLAEENGLIVPINEWVLRTACSQNKVWQEAGISPLRIAVNLSPRQFQQPNLVATVAWILEETGLAPQCLELEITETIIIQNVDFARMMLLDLQAMGIHISMDDFGTGYSSLGYLKKFPFHTLKLDQSFIEELTDNPQDKAIISAVIALGHALNLRVVAEGVETQEQFELLRSLHCEQIQGYLFSRPLCVEDATKFLQDYSPKPMFAALREYA